MHKRIGPPQQTTEQIKIDDAFTKKGALIFNSLPKKNKIKILLLSGLALFIGILSLIPKLFTKKG